MPRYLVSSPARKRFAFAKPRGESARTRVIPLSLVALGVVFGDIGTSPLYAFKECLRHGTTPADVYGSVSLILWSLILPVSIKYVGIVLRADNDGEGGILALLALAFPEKSRKDGINAATIMTAFGVFGAALLYGDGVITPAISNRFAPIWNAAIVLSFYFIVVWLLSRLRQTHQTLEQRVKERTASLSSELTERRRLENEILAIGEREQRRIGLDIHDSLCQHLTGTALAEQFLVEKLAARDAPEVSDANRVVGLIEDAISMAHGIASGLFPLEGDGEGLPAALAELAAHFSSRFKVACRFYLAEPLHIQDTVVANHLYRIAQEAVNNAIRHGRASKIDITLGKDGSGLALVIADDGSGIPANKPIQQGMGLRN
jgi:signal transduction histidine kinase